jgi:hypothetical protein
MSLTKQTHGVVNDRIEIKDFSRKKREFHNICEMGNRRFTLKRKPEMSELHKYSGQYYPRYKVEVITLLENCVPVFGEDFFREGGLLKTVDDILQMNYTQCREYLQEICDLIRFHIETHRGVRNQKRRGLENKLNQLTLTRDRRHKLKSLENELALLRNNKRLRQKQTKLQSELDELIRNRGKET